MVRKLKINKAVLLIAFSSLLSSAVYSQDIHFSQYSGSYMNVNPAFTGLFDGDFRVNGIYRNQWRTVPVPYSTTSFSGDMRTDFKGKLEHDKVGFGLLINTDQAGDAHYKTNQVYLTGAYVRKLKSDSSLWLSGGFSAGFSQSRFNYSLMTFDNQYQNSSYDPALPTGEKTGNQAGFNNTIANLGDVNLGAVLQYNLKMKPNGEKDIVNTYNNRSYFQFGFSYYHLNSAKISYQKNSLIKTDGKINNYAYFQYPITDKLDIIGEAMFTFQGKYKELVPGVQIKMHLDEKKHQSVSAGVYVRPTGKDAINGRIGYTQDVGPGFLTTGLSGDLNISSFVPATNRRGGFDVYFIYILKKKTAPVYKKKVCPIWM